MFKYVFWFLLFFNRGFLTGGGGGATAPLAPPLATAMDLQCKTLLKARRWVDICAWEVKWDVLVCFRVNGMRIQYVIRWHVLRWMIEKELWGVDMRVDKITSDPNHALFHLYAHNGAEYLLLASSELVNILVELSTSRFSCRSGRVFCPGQLWMEKVPREGTRMERSHARTGR